MIVNSLKGDAVSRRLWGTNAMHCSARCRLRFSDSKLHNSGRSVGVRSTAMFSTHAAGSAKKDCVLGDVDGFVFPNERHGVDYATNWAIASTGVSLGKSQLAFRNPSFLCGAMYS